MNREDIIRMAREATFERFQTGEWVCTTEDITVFAALVAAAESEACAKRLDALGCDHCAAAIRARGQA